jgi:ankyrin repeat protein
MAEMDTKTMHETLWRAAAKGDCATIRMLAVNGVDIDAPNDEGFTAFNIATQNGHHEAATTILAAREMAYARQLGETPEEFFGQDKAGKKSA